jgi:predicted cupin superfamily sugar epimerase
LPDAVMSEALQPDPDAPEAVAVEAAAVEAVAVEAVAPALVTPDIVRALDLAPHPEGGWFKETWRSDVSFSPDGYSGPRQSASGIYFLLNPGERSRWHMVRSDEIWLWHMGGPLTLRLGGIGETPDELAAVHFTLGADLIADQHPQVVVPGGVWQSAEPAGAGPVLVTCIVSPGFDFTDFQMI